MKHIHAFCKTHIWLLCCLALYICFFVSASGLGWFDVFFSHAALHVGIKGIDFLQVPQGAWSYWHGGSLSGAHTSAIYAPGEFVNVNVYHPLFTFTIGSVLALMSPHVAYLVWLWAKLPLSLAGVAYFYWSFRDRPYVQLAACLMLVNSTIYLELAAGQYHLLLNLCLLCFLITYERKRYTLAGVWLVLSLLIKPIGLLFLPVLILRGRWRMAVVCVGCFALSLLLFAHDPYYILNLWHELLSPDRSVDIQFFTLDVLLRSLTAWPAVVYSAIQYAALAGILILCIYKRTHMCTTVFLMIVYFLCFYHLVYEYDWSTLVYVVPVCIVTSPRFRTPSALVCAFMLCLPSYFVLFNITHIDVTGGNPNIFAWQIALASKLIPLFLLCAVVCATNLQKYQKLLKIRVKRVDFDINDSI